MAIHFASSHAADFFKLAGVVKTTSIPSAYDPNYVKQTLNCPSGAPNWQQVIPAAVQSDFFWQGRVFIGGSIASTGTPLVSFYSTVSSVMTERFRLQYNGFGPIRLMWYNGAAWVQIGSGLILGVGALYTVTVRFKFHASAGEISFWLNNTLIGRVTGDTTTYGSTFVSDVQFQNPASGSGAGADIDWAEMIVTTNENPYLMKVKTHVLLGPGATSGWTGASTDVDEPDPSSSDILSAATANLVSTFEADDLPALGALVVRAVQVSAVAKRGPDPASPQNIQLALRASGVDQLSPTKALDTGYNTVFHVYETNSVTGTEFTKAEIDASEPGVKSIA